MNTLLKWLEWEDISEIYDDPIGIQIMLNISKWQLKKVLNIYDKWRM